MYYHETWVLYCTSIFLMTVLLLDVEIAVQVRKRPEYESVSI